LDKAHCVPLPGHHHARIQFARKTLSDADDGSGLATFASESLRLLQQWLMK
jgi:hypothetical protein